MPFYSPAELPEWRTTRWFNTPEPLTLAALRGRVVVLYAFQMLCETCVTLTLPQAQRVHGSFPAEAVSVVGLHTVFESHTRMDEPALARFLSAAGYSFPVGIDAPGLLWMPQTMEAYRIEGTPSLLLIDRRGRRRLHKLGHQEDAALWPLIEALGLEKA